MRFLARLGMAGARDVRTEYVILSGADALPTAVILSEATAESKDLL